MARSRQTLDEADRRTVAAWAADCAEHVLPLFEREAPDDGGPRDAIERARAYSRGDLDTAEQIRLRLVAGRSAHAATGLAGAAAARSAAQAAAVAHMGAHALGAAAYAVKAVALAEPERPDAAEREVRRQLHRLTPAQRIALARLPALGEDPAGPLGMGLLTRGVLGDAIRELQREISAEGSTTR